MVFFCVLGLPHTTNIVVVVLIVVVHIPIVEIHIPSVIGIIGLNRGRPNPGIIIRKSDPDRYGFLRNQPDEMPQCG